MLIYRFWESYAVKLYSNLITRDTILHLQVSEVSSGNHKLKSEFHGDVQVEWPHYNEAEKALIRR